MKTIPNRLINTLIVFAALMCFANPGRAAEIEPLQKNHFVLLMPGITRTVNIIQDSDFPTGISNTLVLALGYGGVSIEWSESNNDDGDLLVLSGVSLSSAGIIPFVKFGRTPIQIRASIEIGTAGFPFGLIWISSSVRSTVTDPSHSYQLRLTANLTFYN